MYEVGLLHLRGLVAWPNRVGVLWSPIALSPLPVSVSAGFYSQKLGEVLFLALAPKLGAWCGTGTSHSSVGIPAAKLSILIFIYHMWVSWDQPQSRLHPSYQSQRGFFFNSIVVGLLFSWISGGFEWWLLCSLLVILMWMWGKWVSHLPMLPSSLEICELLAWDLQKFCSLTEQAFKQQITQASSSPSTSVSPLGGVPHLPLVAFPSPPSETWWDLSQCPACMQVAMNSSDGQW